MKLVVGIDPGKKGGIALYDMEGDVMYQVYDMPETPRDLWDLIALIPKDAPVYLEKVHGMVGDGGAQAFKFGNSYGHIEMAIIGNALRLIHVTPQTWQKALQLPSRADCGAFRGCTKTQKSQAQTKKKNVHKMRAQSAFPKTRVTHDRADAMLIAVYGKLFHNPQASS